jgi:PEP-CTERM motif
MPVLKPRHRSTVVALVMIVTSFSIRSLPANADIITFFNATQIAEFVSSGTVSDTIRSNGYLFTYSRDKLFTGGLGGGPIGRLVRVPWPQGVEAQAITEGAPPTGAQVTLSRVDGSLFDISSFTFRLLANTAGAGGSIEVMPKLNGEDAFPDPFQFNASGFAGNSFTYDPTLLTQFESYTFKLYVDYAITGMTLQGAAVPEPSSLLMSGLGMFCWMTKRRFRNLNSRDRIHSSTLRGSDTAYSAAQKNGTNLQGIHRQTFWCHR